MNKNNNSQTSQNNGVEGRLEAIVALLAELLPQNNKMTERAKDKAAAALLKAGVSQDESAKLLGIKRGRVTKIAKVLKI